MLNKVCVMGRLTAAPELKATNTGKSVCSFSIACSKPRVNGEDRPPDFFDVVAWKHNAEFICKWFDKGDVIIIDGRLQSRTYEDKNGNKRKAVEVVAEGVNFGGKKNRENRQQEETPLPDEWSDISPLDTPFDLVRRKRNERTDA